MKTIYVVIGMTGEYASRSEWLVAVYEEVSEAIIHVDKASKRAREIFNEGDWDYHTNYAVTTNEYDPGMQMQYTGTGYKWLPVPRPDTIKEFVSA